MDYRTSGNHEQMSSLEGDQSPRFIVNRTSILIHVFVTHRGSAED